MGNCILIVDGDKQFAGSLRGLLEGEGFEVAIAQNAAAAKKWIDKLRPEVTLVDLSLSDGAGHRLLETLRNSFPDRRYIGVAGSGVSRMAIDKAAQLAQGMLFKPFALEKLLELIRLSPDEEERMHLEVPAAAMDLEALACACELHEKSYLSEPMQEVMALAHRAAKQHTGIVLLLGESGSGKDYLAYWVHHNSPRRDKPIVCVNCAALPKELAESELFGHEHGSFTGTRGRKRGLVELAQDGSLLLNEIGELDLALQSKLLTFLDTRTFRRVGGEKSVSVDARIFAATNRDLALEVEQGTFRQDLFYRINVFPIHLPPLRERLADLAQLAEERLLILAKEMGLRTPPKLHPDALRMLIAYDWPGNIRELRNVLERALLVSDGRMIMPAHLNLRPSGLEWKVTVPFTKGNNYHEAIKEASKRLIVEALRRAKTKKEAADILGISRHALAHQMKVLGIDA